MEVDAFGERVQEYLRLAGKSQKNLADAIGLHPKVLSRKLRASGNASLNHIEIKNIIFTLAQWNVLNSRAEVFQLLHLMNMKPGSFTSNEWRHPPLNQLEAPAEQLPPSVALPAPRHNIPAPATGLIGREWIVERLKDLLGQEEVRLVTLVGAGGSGKTRLAQQVAIELSSTFTDGAWFVPLIGVQDPDLVPVSIMEVLNIKPLPNISSLQSLVTYWRGKSLLLVLDNFEQVGDAASMIGVLLAKAADLKILVTSRVVLHLYGERQLSVPPLDLPSPDALNVEMLEQYSAIQLFLERVQAVIPDFTLNAGNGSSVAQICTRLDGLPLALELAAARVKLLPPARLLERLETSRLSLLTGGARNLPGKQQTLRSTFEWSYQLLSPDGQRWFPRLGIFTGGWSLDAGEAMIESARVEKSEAIQVSNTPAETTACALDILGQLMDSSLLMRRVTAGRIYFSMLETLREYALELLSACEELEQLRYWHVQYYLKVAEATRESCGDESKLILFEQMAEQKANLEAALQWSWQRACAEIGNKASSNQDRAHERAAPDEQGPRHHTQFSQRPLSATELCLRLVVALSKFWEWQGLMAEERRWLKEVLSLPLKGKTGRRIRQARAEALTLHTSFLHSQGERFGQICN